MKTLSVTAIVIATFGALALPPPLAAQSYPAKSVRVVVPFPPGGGWFAMYFPAGTPREIVGTINAAVRKALETKDVRALFERDALVPIGGTPEELSAHLKSEIARYGEVIRKGNITLQ